MLDRGNMLLTGGTVIAAKKKSAIPSSSALKNAGRKSTLKKKNKIKIKRRAQSPGVKKKKEK